MRSVHPHMRGELPDRGIFYRAARGSSPHAWGTVTLEDKARLPGRFIPTCVGNCRAGSNHSRYIPVHPHMRGELSPERPQYMNAHGSSPHAWGTGSLSGGHVVFLRFIPTCVGNWPIVHAASVVASVHPHMRGELIISGSFLSGKCGSSPHAWGTVCLSCHSYIIRRFIPTCVGNWETPELLPIEFSVHPHMRGELIGIKLNGSVIAGSSPHAWGTGNGTDWQHSN